MITWIKAHVVPGARQAWRWWSIRLNALGLALLAWVSFDPVSVLAVWNMMPRQLHSISQSPPFVAIAIALFVLSMLARVVRQPKLEQR